MLGRLWREKVQEEWEADSPNEWTGMPKRGKSLLREGVKELLINTASWEKTPSKSRSLAYSWNMKELVSQRCSPCVVLQSSWLRFLKTQYASVSWEGYNSVIICQDALVSHKRKLFWIIFVWAHFASSLVSNKGIVLGSYISAMLVVMVFFLPEERLSLLFES